MCKRLTVFAVIIILVANMASVVSAAGASELAVSVSRNIVSKQVGLNISIAECSDAFVTVQITKDSKGYYRDEGYTDVTGTLSFAFINESDGGTFTISIEAPMLSLTKELTYEQMSDAALATVIGQINANINNPGTLGGIIQANYKGLGLDSLFSEQLIGNSAIYQTIANSGLSNLDANQFVKEFSRGAVLIDLKGNRSATTLESYFKSELLKAELLEQLTNSQLLNNSTLRSIAFTRVAQSAANYNNFSDLSAAIAFQTLSCIITETFDTALVDSTVKLYYDSGKLPGLNWSYYQNSSDKNAAIRSFMATGPFSNYAAIVTAFNNTAGKPPSGGDNKPPPGGNPNSGFSGGGGGSSVVSLPPTPLLEELLTSPQDQQQDEQNVGYLIFEDLLDALWASKAITNLYKLGIVNGVSETEFQPNRAVTRAEAVKMLILAFKLSELETEPTFHDVSADDWYYSYVKIAWQNDLVRGSDGYFNPNSEITREEMATILSRLVGGVVNPQADFTDMNKVSSWAVSAVNNVVAKKLMNGYPSGEFMPQRVLTRAEAATVINNSLEVLEGEK